jgi:hypothetical protein
VVLTILSESASAVESMVRTTMLKLDRAKTSLVEALTILTLVARSRSKAPNDTPFDNDPNLLNFVAEVSCVTSWMSYQLQRY